jgi:hypothetical protein
LIRQKILDSAVDVVSEALSMHVAPQATRMVVVLVGVTVMLGFIIHHVARPVRWAPPYLTSL